MAPSTVGGSELKRSKNAKAGSNWKKLQKTIATHTSDKRRRRSSTDSANRVGTSDLAAHAPTLDEAKVRSLKNGTSNADRAVLSPAPTSLPWFAEDLSPQDLALVRTSSNRSLGAGSVNLDDVAAASSSHSTSRDNAHPLMGDSEEALLRKRVILSGGSDTLPKEKREPGTYVAIDCEMVGVGPKGSESILARVSIVNWHGAVLLDTFVRPKEKVTDYRTWVSGVRASDLKDAPTFDVAQARVAALIKDRILVGHAIHNDLRALLLGHPKHMIRDTASFAGSRKIANSKYPSLRKLVALQLGIEIQAKGASHSSVEDAQATMALYRTLHAEWQKSLQSSQHGANRKALKKSASSTQIIGPGWKKNKTDVQADASLASDGPASKAKTSKKRAAPEDTEWWSKV